MISIQEIAVRMHNGDRALLQLLQVNGSFRADMDYRPTSGPSFDAFEGPVMSNAAGAFDFVMGVVERMAQVRSTSIDVIDNPCNTEFLEADVQKAILARRSVTASIFVNGAAA
jgi:hypothetical protein